MNIFEAFKNSDLQGGKTIKHKHVLLFKTNEQKDGTLMTMFLTIKSLPIWCTDRSFLCRNGASYSKKKRKGGRRWQREVIMALWRSQAVGEKAM